MNRPKIKRMAATWAFCILFASPLFADTVVLKDGTTLHGRLVGQDPSTLVLEVEGKPQAVAKSTVRMFREDETGLAFYRQRLKETEAAELKQKEELDQTLDKFAFPDGLLIQLAGGAGKHDPALRNVIDDDRVKDNVLLRGSSAAFDINHTSGTDRGIEGMLQLRRSRWFVEAGGSSYSTKVTFQTYGLPALSAIIIPTPATVDQAGLVAVSPVQKQDAYGIVAFEPHTFSARFRWYLLAGASGEHQMARAEGPIGASARVGSFVVTNGIYLDNFQSTASLSGHRLGLDLRFRFQGGAEVQVRGWGSEMKGWTKGRGTLLGTDFQKIVQDGRTRVRSYAGQTAFFFPLASRFRLFAGVYAEDYRQTLFHRTDLQYPSYLTPSNIDFRKMIVRLNDRPTHSGRVSRFFAGTELRL